MLLRSLTASGLVATGLFLAVGCTSAPNAAPTSQGFLSDYSRLTADGADLRFAPDAALANYRSFIVEPIQIYFYDASSDEVAPSEELEVLAEYLDRALREMLVERAMIVAEPAPGVAHLRIALTDIDSQSPVLGVLPASSRSSLVLGGATMEAELIDSWTGEQVGAVVQSQAGSALSLAGIESWDTARAVIDAWIARFGERLDETRD